MRSRGLSQIEIAHELQVSEASISSDVQYLREQARGSIKEYIIEHLPEQYEVCPKLWTLYSFYRRPEPQSTQNAAPGGLVLPHV
jgi:hypothetical protein